MERILGESWAKKYSRTDVPCNVPTLLPFSPPGRQGLFIVTREKRRRGWKVWEVWEVWKVWEA
ncbi:hypothetical protein CYANOKiyG1_59980 [Okeania sp. KiyG1]|nr:hypothetical protein CYANOKiyG1_59980 [Okeania sp. KiyG1]